MSLEIIAVSGDFCAEVIELWHEGFEPPGHLQDREYGPGMVASFTKDKGEVFCAGTCEWVAGLIHQDEFTKLITKNVLGKFTSRRE
ncbi:hypothetical protein BDW75DRAFT_244949 [Aspergillus navahoensis]